jgi:hypothetical protein
MRVTRGAWHELNRFPGAPTDGGTRQRVSRQSCLACAASVAAKTDWDARHQLRHAVGEGAGHVRQPGAATQTRSTLVCACPPSPTTVSVPMAVRASEVKGAQRRPQSPLPGFSSRRTQILTGPPSGHTSVSGMSILALCVAAPAFLTKTTPHPNSQHPPFSPLFTISQPSHLTSSPPSRRLPHLPKQNPQQKALFNRIRTSDLEISTMLSHAVKQRVVYIYSLPLCQLSYKEED